MNETGKQRIVGVGVLVVFLVVFIPFTLSHRQASTSSQTAIQIPNPPAKPVQHLATHVAAIKPKAKPKPIVLAQVSPKAWVVQLASFSKLENASSHFIRSNPYSNVGHYVQF